MKRQTIARVAGKYLLLCILASLSATPSATAQSDKTSAPAATPTKTKKKPKKKSLIDAPITATTQDGRTVILRPNGRWEFTANPVAKRDSVPAPLKRPPESLTFAMKELHKMQAATEVGITLQEYSSRLIDLKASVDEALRQVSDPELKRELRFAVEAYSDGLDLWNRQLNTRYPLKQSGDMLREEAKDICEKYGIKEFSTSTGGAEIVNGKKALNFIWFFAKTAIEKADKLVAKQTSN
ncbi:MAG: hypothetical protein ACK42Y_04740 [Candidatus Thermochlorobacter sp.]